MGKPQFEQTADGKDVHVSVGAVIAYNRKYLLIDRKNPPYGFAGLAGHVDVGEDVVQALKREVSEESGLVVDQYRLAAEEVLTGGECVFGVSGHHWYVFECVVHGKVKKGVEEAKSIAWYTPKEMQELVLEPVWTYWFQKLGIIN